MSESERERSSFYVTVPVNLELSVFNELFCCAFQIYKTNLVVFLSHTNCVLVLDKCTPSDLGFFFF